MILKLPEPLFLIAKNINYELCSPIFTEKDLTVDVNDIDAMLSDINYEIAGPGMDNQDTINEYGIKLYSLYDEILSK